MGTIDLRRGRTWLVLHTTHSRWRRACRIIVRVQSHIATQHDIAIARVASSNGYVKIELDFVVGHPRDTGAAWTVSGNDSASGLGIIGIANGDTIDLTGFVAVSDTFANNILVLTDAGGAQNTLTIQGTSTSSSFQLSSDGNGATDVVVCFAAGTHIGTPGGEVPVEKLKIGDLVLTAHNGPRPVTWIGQGKVLATRGRRTAATPVIVHKGALADNVPNRDLHVTKVHSLYIDDVLIPVEVLVNDPDGHSIRGGNLRPLGG
jgi:hypothetical protein